ncbi:MAG: hypothetical protein RI902_574 [Pseudomonadota bacterium]|jgi:hypothetical protein
MMASFVGLDFYLWATLQGLWSKREEVMQKM